MCVNCFKPGLCPLNRLLFISITAELFQNTYGRCLTKTQSCTTPVKNVYITEIIINFQDILASTSMITMVSISLQDGQSGLAWYETHDSITTHWMWMETV